MIAAVADYRFVDFANGDLPTGNINGAVMPLRAGAAQSMLKAEDVAFLHEGVRDKVGALMGLKVHNTTLTTGLGPGTSRVPRGDPPYTVGIPLTKQVKGSQMQDLVYYMSLAAQSGTSGVRFMENAIVEDPNHYQSSASDGGAGFYSLPQIATGVQPASNGAAFAAGQPVAKAPMLTLFEDLKLFCKPVVMTGIGFGSYPYHFDASDFAVMSTDGSATPYAPRQGLLYQMSDSFAYVNVLKNDTVSILTVPTEFVNPAFKVWWRFAAYNERYVRATGAAVYDYRNGMIDITRHLTPVDANGTRTAYMTSVGSLNLLRRVENLYGWTEHARGGTYQSQLMVITDKDEFVIEFEPNGRTQWWT